MHKLKKIFRILSIWLFYLLIVSLPFQIKKSYFFDDSYNKGVLIFYNTNSLYLIEILGFLLSISFLLYILFFEFHVERFRKSILMLAPAFIFLILSFVSLLVHRETMIFGLFKAIIISLLIVIFCFIINILTVKHMFHTSFWLILANSCIQSSIGIFQYFGQKSLGLYFLGEEFIRSYIPGLAKFKQALGQKWIVDKLLGVYHETFIVRAYGTFPHPNVYGSFIVIGLMMSIYLLFVCRETWKRIFFAFAIFLQTTGLAISFSRVAIVSFALAFLGFFALMFIMKRNEREQRKNLFFTLSMVISAAIFTGLLFYPQFLERGGVVSYGTTNKEAISDRRLYQTISLHMITQHPWMGVGIQNFTRVMDGHTPIPLQAYQHQPVHNIFLLIAAESGIPAAIAFCIYLAYIVYLGYRKKESPLVAALLCMVLAYIFISFFDHYPYSLAQGQMIFFLLLGFLTASTILDQDIETSESIKTKQPRLEAVV